MGIADKESGRAYLQGWREWRGACKGLEMCWEGQQDRDSGQRTKATLNDPLGDALSAGSFATTHAGVSSTSSATIYKRFHAR